MRIQHNTTSMNANRMMKVNTSSLAGSTEKLSSGYKINRAADDAAGLSISEKMRKQMRGLNRGSTNCDDGVSLCQVADGALNEVSDMLNRMKVLSIQSANGTNSQSDRAAIDAEVQALKEEAQRIFDTTTFNGKYIWKGENTYADRYNYEEVVSLRINSISRTYTPTTDNTGVWPSAGFNVTADESSGIKFSWTGRDGTSYESDDIPWPNPENKSQTLQLEDYLTHYYEGGVLPSKFQGVNATISYASTEYTKLEDIVKNVNGTTLNTDFSSSNRAACYDAAGGRLSYTTNVYLSDEIQRLSERDTSGASDSEFAECTGVNIPDSATDTSTFTIDFAFRNVGTITATLNSISYSKNSFSGNLEADHMTTDCKSYDEAHGISCPVGDVSYTSHMSNDKWWGYAPAYSSSEGYLGYYTKQSPVMSSSGGTGASIAYALTNSTTLGGLLDNYTNDGDTSDSGYMQFYFTLSDGAGSLNFRFPVYESDTVDSVFAKLNEIASIDIFASADGSDIHGVSGNAGPSSVTVYNAYKSFTKMADVKYEEFVGPGKNTEDIHSADEADMTVKIPINYDKLNNEYLGIKELNVMTEKASDEAMGLIDKAAEIITTQRSVFGAYQNRLEHTIKNIDNVVENTTAAESRIRDTDMAEEMVKLSRSNILQQAGQSVLAQANQTPQGVLSLLQ